METIGSTYYRTGINEARKGNFEKAFYQEKYFWDGLLRGGSPECGNSLVCRNRRVEQVKCRNLFFLGSEMKGLCFLYK